MLFLIFVSSGMVVPEDLKEQASAPIENPIEMGHTFTEVIDTLNQNIMYREHF